METFKPNRISKDNFLTQFLEVLLIVISTLILIIIFEILKKFFLIELNFWFNNLIIIILASIASAILARFIFYNLSQRQLITPDRVNEKDKVKNQFRMITQTPDKINNETLMEIADQINLEKAVSESEAQLRIVINKAPIGIVLLDKDGIIIECNPAFQGMLGYDRQELIGAGFNQATHPGDVSLSKKHYKELIEGKIDVHRMEQRFIHKDLRGVWGSLSASVVRNTNGEIRFIFVTIEDITERREAEKKIVTYQKKLRSLTSKLSLTEEHNRHLYATNLHDHIGQVLLWIRLKISKLHEDSGEDPDFQEIINLIDQVIKYTRFLIYELSPPILYELGFEETIEWLSENLAKEHGIRSIINRDEHPKPLNTEMSILLFQAVREVMDNIVKHAKATFVTTAIKQVDDDLIVMVEDNGVGFDPHGMELQLPKDHGLGLFSIRERFEHLGGRLEIESGPGKGTMVTLSLPLAHNNKKRNWTDLLKRNMPPRNG